MTLRQKKKSRGFGERAHKGSRVLKMINRSERAGGGYGGKRKLGLTVFVGRYVAFTHDGDRRGRFWAKVCPKSAASKWRKLDKPRDSRCGPDGYGPTPTRAVESALVALAKSHNLRK